MVRVRLNVFVFSSTLSLIFYVSLIHRTFRLEVKKIFLTLHCHREAAIWWLAIHHHGRGSVPVLPHFIYNSYSHLSLHSAVQTALSNNPKNKYSGVLSFTVKGIWVEKQIM